MAAKEEEFLRLRQHIRSIQEFTEQFRLLEKYAHLQDEKRRVSSYLSKLGDYYCPYLVVLRNATFDEILEAVTSVEHARPRSSSVGKTNDKKSKTPDGQQRSQFLKGVFCHHYNKEGHKRLDYRALKREEKE